MAGRKRKIKYFLGTVNAFYFLVVSTMRQLLNGTGFEMGRGNAVRE